MLVRIAYIFLGVALTLTGSQYKDEAINLYASLHHSFNQIKNSSSEQQKAEEKKVVLKEDEKWKFKWGDNSKVIPFKGMFELRKSEGCSYLDFEYRNMLQPKEGEILLHPAPENQAIKELKRKGIPVQNENLQVYNCSASGEVIHTH